MKYALLIYQDDEQWESMSHEAHREISREYFALRDDLKTSGQYLDGQRLAPTIAATSVRRREGETLITDGPFADTKEQFAGFWIIEAPNLDEAIVAAARTPAARYGTIEVRPIVELPSGPLE
ncbi:MAG: YciI family protein [Candidatus Eremiobacteraeota bacterium]|nr:YciI family protein [Candidatus Eremiobacteraeota bacterium]